MRLALSIIIPTFNEEKYLPRLLTSIKKQTVHPQEVIVCDAFSLDQTRKIAKEFGCILEEGGLPAKARNNGAKKASSDLFLFLDADVILPPPFLEKTIKEMQNRNLDIASCYLMPISHLTRDIILHNAANYYLKITKDIYPHIPGFCIFVKKSLHEKIRGFDESVILAEDHDYVQRAKKYGHFAYLHSYKIPVSVRRLNEDGRIKLALKYIAVELHLLTLGKIKKNFFTYKFGNHSILDTMEKVENLLKL